MRLSVACAPLGAVCLAFANPAYAQRAPIVLEPSSAWNVDFAETRCRLLRIFSDGEDRHILFIEQHYPSASAGLTVAGPSFRRFRNRSSTLLNFSSASDPRETEPFTGTLGSIGPAVIYSNIKLFDQPEIEPDGATSQSARPAQLDTSFGASIEYVSLKQRSREVRFETGALDQAFDVLNNCTQDLVRAWGFDVDQHKNAMRLPEWLNELEVVERIQADYPDRALRRGVSTVLRMRVTVNEEGQVTECFLIAATDNELESPVCEVMSDAEFAPALDSNGQPFRSFYTTSITYQIND